DQVLKHLCWAPIVKGTPCFVLSCADRPVLSVVEFVQHYRVAGAVENDDGHRPIVLCGVSLRSGHHLLSRLKPDWSSIGRCRGRRRSLLSAGGHRKLPVARCEASYVLVLGFIRHIF